MGQLAGKVAVITGGSSGIGLGAARAFVAEGAHVCIIGRRQSELDKAQAAIGHDVTAFQGDITSHADLDRVFAAVKSQRGAIDILVASAGFVERMTLETATPEHYDKTFAINTRGTFFTVQKALPLMNKGGSIVLISSMAHMKGFPGHSTYGASKAALRSFARTWANELKERGIRVNTLSPGMIDTPIIDGQYTTKEEADAVRKRSAQNNPMGRIGRVEEMAAAILFLASSDSSFTTGSDLVADGGLTQL